MTLSLPRLPTLSAEFHCDDGPEGEWAVSRVTLFESLDGLYSAEIDIASTLGFDTPALIGADCSLCFVRGGEESRRLNGVVVSAEDLGELDHHVHVRVEIAPAFALLDDGSSTRIWQDKPVRSIIEAVLGPALGVYGRSFDFGAVTRGAEPRDYCVQFRESDHDFVCRLLEEEGIAFDFLHAPGSKVEVLCFRDAPNQYPALELITGGHEIPLIDHDTTDAEVESIQAVTRLDRSTVSKVLRRDYTWKSPRDLMSEAKGGADERGRERRIYAHEARRYINDSLAERAADQLAAELVDRVAISGRSNVSALLPGRRFTLIESRPELDGDYIVTKVEHEYTFSTVADGDDDEENSYANTFISIPADAEHRPRQRTPKPRVHGPHTATVVGDEEIHTDIHGRIQVQFHWEETPSFAAGASCWIRCAQSWAGPGWGAQFIPRVGMEVIVEFLEGNPDRPLVVGCAYNGINPPPFAVPENKTQSGWRTSSSLGGEGYNMLRFEDLAGEEEIFIHGQKDWNIVIEHDKGQRIGNDESLLVQHDRSKTVDHDEDESIGHDRSIRVGRHHREVIAANMSLSVGASQTVDVGENATETVREDKTIDVGEEMFVTVGDRFTLVCGESSIILKKSGAIQIKGKTIKLLADKISEN